VFEVHRLNHRPNTVRPSLTSGWLAFVSVQEKRRLPQYPARWAEMTDKELQGLLDAAFLAPAPRYPVRGTGAADSTSVSPAVASGATTSTDNGEGLPVPLLASVSGTLGHGGVDSLVRAHARRARQDGVAVIAGMLGVKRALRDAGEDASRETLRLLRKVFIDEFYFSR